MFSFQGNIKNISFDSLYSKINELVDQQNNEQALFFAQQLLSKAVSSNNDTLVAKSYYKLGVIQNRIGARDSSFYYFNRSKKLYLIKKDSIQIARCLLNLAIIESDFGDYINSDISAISALKFLNGKREKTIVSLYNTLAINSKKQLLYSQAIYNYKKALSFNVSTKQRIVIKNNLVNVYKENNEFSKSILILESLLQDSIKNQKTKARITDNLAHIKWLQNSKSNVLENLLQAKAIRQKEKDNYGLMASYSHLSDYFKEKDKNKSLFYAQEMYAKAKTENATNGLLEAIDKIVVLQNAENSIKYLKESIHIRDSLQPANTQQQYKFAKIKYNYEEEEKQKLTFKNIATESELLLEQENNQKKNILILGILLISALVFLLYRRKQQNRKLILQENYNTETRIAKKLHDELGNGIYNIITKVQNRHFKTDEIVSDLDKIYLQTRKISHENDAVETGHKFEEFLKSLISSYNSDRCKIILKDIPVLALNTANKETQITIYRVFNELLVNMKKHSKATLVVISCKKNKRVYEIIYIDNGVGFLNHNFTLKNGLANVETRIHTIGGNITFENQHTKGCKITIRFTK